MKLEYNIKKRDSVQISLTPEMFTQLAKTLQEKALFDVPVAEQIIRIEAAFKQLFPLAYDHYVLDVGDE